jgi:hypothetical protein
LAELVSDPLAPLPALDPLVVGVLRGLPGAERPELPPALAARLNSRELRTVWLMVAGRSYGEALDACRIPKAARIRRTCPPHVREAAEYLVRKTAEACGASREWILTQLVHLYRAASRSAPVLDRQGRATGEYRFDGATATRCLELLGNQAGMFGKRVVHDVAGDVRELMRLVAERGRPQLAAPGGSVAALPAQVGRVLDAGS